MKKEILLLTILCMVLWLCGCGDGATETTATKTVTTTESTATTTTETVDTTTTEALDTTTTESVATTTTEAVDTTTTEAVDTTTTQEEVTTTETVAATTTAKPSTTTTEKVTATTTVKPTTSTTSQAVTTTTTTTTTTTSTTTAPTHVHVFEEATCEKAKTCSCGATEGERIDHDYRYFVCKWCKAKEQGPFVNLNDYYWKYGEEDTSNHGAVVQLFDFADDEFIEGWCGNFSTANTFEDLDAYTEKFCQMWNLWVYDYHYYEMSVTVKLYYTFEETDTHVNITFLDGDGGEIRLEKKDRATLKVISNTFTGRFGDHLPVGAELTAYPRWEDV